MECEVHTLKDSGEGTSYAEALEKSKAEKEARDVAKESNRNENREERGEKAKAITMRTKEEHESFVSTETKTDHVAAVLKPKEDDFANNPSFGITRAMIEQRFHMPLAEAAKECGVGRTTFKESFAHTASNDGRRKVYTTGPCQKGHTKRCCLYPCLQWKRI